MAILKTYKPQVGISGEGAAVGGSTGEAQVWGQIGQAVGTVANVVGKFKQRANDANDSVIDTQLKNKGKIYSENRVRIIERYGRLPETEENMLEMQNELSTIDSDFDADYTSTIGRYKSDTKRAVATANYEYMTGKKRDAATEIMYSTERAKTTSIEKEVSLMESIALGDYEGARSGAKSAFEAGNIGDDAYKRVLIKADSEEVKEQESIVQADKVDLTSLSALDVSAKEIQSAEYRAKFPKIKDSKWRTFEKQIRQQKNYIEKKRDDDQRENMLDMQARATSGLLGYTDVDIAESDGEMWDSEGQPVGINKYQSKILRGFLDRQTEKALPSDVANNYASFKKDIEKDNWFGGKFETEKELVEYLKDVSKDESYSPNQRFYLYNSAAKAYNLVARDPNNGEYFSSRLAEITQMEARAAQYDGSRDPAKNMSLYLDSFGDNIEKENVDKIYEARKEALSGVLRKAITAESMKKRGQISVTAPDGSQGYIPVEDVEQARKEGYTING